jgi:hypothetical protein
MPWRGFHNGKLVYTLRQKFFHPAYMYIQSICLPVEEVNIASKKQKRRDEVEESIAAASQRERERANELFRPYYRCCACRQQETLRFHYSFDIALLLWQEEEEAHQIQT